MVAAMAKSQASSRTGAVRLTRSVKSSRQPVALLSCLSFTNGRRGGLRHEIFRALLPVDYLPKIRDIISAPVLIPKIIAHCAIAEAPCVCFRSPDFPANFATQKIGLRAHHRLLAKFRRQSRRGKSFSKCIAPDRAGSASRGCKANAQLDVKSGFFMSFTDGGGFGTLPPKKRENHRAKPNDRHQAGIFFSSAGPHRHC